MTQTVFIDGEVGTTGLQIRERLKNRSDLSFLRLDDFERKDLARRSELCFNSMNQQCILIA